MGVGRPCLSQAFSTLCSGVKASLNRMGDLAPQMQGLKVQRFTHSSIGQVQHGTCGEKPLKSLSVRAKTAYRARAC